MKSEQGPQITLISTVPTPGRKGTINGQPMSDPDWQRLREESRALNWEKRSRLATAGLREIEVHQGKTSITLLTKAAPLPQMAREALTHIAADHVIRKIYSGFAMIAMRVTGEEGDNIVYVTDVHPGTY